MLLKQVRQLFVFCGCVLLVVQQQVAVGRVQLGVFVMLLQQVQQHLSCYELHGTAFTAILAAIFSWVLVSSRRSPFY
jgi:hypothetical protein